MFAIVCLLNFASAFGFVNCSAHTIGDTIAIHNDPALNVASCPANCLDEATLATEEAFFVGIHNRHQAHFWQIDPLTQEVDPHQDIIQTHTQITQNVAALERVDLAVDIGRLDAEVGQIGGEILSHPLGKRCHEHALLLAGVLANFCNEVIYLSFSWADYNLRVEQASGANHLLSRSGAALELIIARGSRDINHLVDVLIKFIKAQWTIV